MGFNYVTPGTSDQRFKTLLASRGHTHVPETSANIDYVLLHQYTHPAYALLGLEGHSATEVPATDLMQLNWYFSAKAMRIPVVALRHSAFLIHTITGGTFRSKPKDTPNTFKMMNFDGNLIPVTNVSDYIIPETEESLYDLVRKREIDEKNTDEHIELFTDYGMKFFGFYPSVGYDLPFQNWLADEIELFIENC